MDEQLPMQGKYTFGKEENLISQKGWMGHACVRTETIFFLFDQLE